MKVRQISLLLLFALTLFPPQLEAKYVVQQGKLRDARNVPTKAIEELYQEGIEAIKEERWREAQEAFRPIVHGYLNSPYGKDSLFYLGVSLFHMEEYDQSLSRFTTYLEDQRDLKFFEEAVRYQLAIADAYRKGAKKRLLGKESLPKWASAKKDSIKVYDQVIATMPSGDPAVEALYAKGHLFFEVRQFRESVECFAQLTQNFPRHELTPKAYLAIGKVFHKQAELEHQNPDLLALAELNLQRFKQALPSHEGIEEAEKGLKEMQEFYAEGLWETGQFYERTKHPKASAMYYFCAIKKFPETRVASKCRDRLQELNEVAKELNLSVEQAI